MPAISGIGEEDAGGSEAVTGVSCCRQAAARRTRMSIDRFISSSERIDTAV
jgi:hypothetical protein